MKKYITPIFMLFLFSVNSFAQNSNGNDAIIRYGVFLNYGFLNTSSDFRTLPGIPNCCPEFKNGNGSSVYFGGLYEYNFSGIALEGRVGIDLTSGKFKADEHKIFGVNGEPTPGTFEHTIDYNITNINLDIAFKYSFYKKFNISVGLGTSASMGSSFNQSERISTPANITFVDSLGNNTGSSVRNQANGDIPELNKMNFNTHVKLGYDYPLKTDQTLILRPEIGFRYSFTDAVKNLEWKTSSVSLGFSLLFSSYKIIEPEEPDSELTSKEYIDSVSEELNIANLRNQAELKHRREMEEKFRLEQLEKERISRELAVKDSLLKISQEIQQKEALRIAAEKEEFNKMIEDENKKTGKACNCYIILFITTKDKHEAENLLKKLKQSGFEDISLTQFNDQYLNDKFYRVQSKCYSNHLNAFDDRIKAMKTISDNISPQILCNR